MLDLRAKARGLSRSRYAAMVFEKWRDQGYPALDTVDSTARALVKQEIDNDKSRKANPQATAGKVGLGVWDAKAEAVTQSEKRKLKAIARNLGPGKGKPAKAA